MSRRTAAAAGLLALLLAGEWPAKAQQWVGERLCAAGLPRNGAFGSAVAVGEDGTIAAGDYLHDVVYLFRRDDAGRCEQSSTIQSPDRGSWFGFDLAIDRDGLLVVGAPRAAGTGTAYLVKVMDGRRVSELRQVSGLNPRPGPGDEAGSAVAIDGGILAIGARGADDRQGRVYAGPEGSLTAVSMPPNLAQRAELGQSVSLSGKTLVMGAPSPFRGSGSPGAAYVFEVGSVGTAIPLPTDLEPEAAFGYAVAVGRDRILVGAPLADRSNGRDAGMVFGFQRKDGSWVPDSQPLRPGGPGAQLGVAVALDGGTAVIGARYENGTRGAAYLVTASGSLQILQPRESLPVRAQFGFSVAIRNGIVVIGAFREGEGRTGAAYQFVESLPDIHLAPIADVQESSTTITVTVRAVAPVSRDVTVQIATEDGTAKVADGDYTPFTAETVTLPAGQTEVKKVLSVIRQDSFCEDEEIFMVALFDPPGGEAVQKVPVKIIDDDTGGLELTPAPLPTSEDGTSSQLSVRLTCPPFEPVKVSLAAIPPLADFSPAERTFTHENWSQPQTVSVSGTDNADCGPAVTPYEIQATTTSEDPRYAGLSQSIPAENRDDERACLSADMTVCTDAGGTVIYTITLANSVSGVPGTPAELRDILPPEVSVVTASADRGTATADPIVNSIHWTGLVPAAEDTVTITIVAALDVPPGPTVRNFAVVTYDRDGRRHSQSVQIDEVSFQAGDILLCP